MIVMIAEIVFSFHFPLSSCVRDVINFVLNHTKWRTLMCTCSSDRGTGEMTTPMRMLIENMPEIAEQVMDRCVQHNSKVNPNDPDYWVEFYYEFLEDSFSKWTVSYHNSDDHAIYVDECEDIETETSFVTRLNGEMTSNYTADDEKLTSTTGPYHAKGHLKVDAKPYTTSSKDIALNHPLNIMVSAEKTNLLSHPLVGSLLNHKWNKVGRFFFWTSLVFYLLFVIMLTGYVLIVPPSYYVRSANATDGVTWFTNGEDRWVGEFSEAALFFFGRLGNWIILTLAVINVIRECFQMYYQRRSYFNFGNLMEWTLYVLAILLVLPLSRIQYYNGIYIRLDWQWQCGAVAVFLAWINLILFIRRFSILGIYVIMIIDISRAFMKFVLVLILFIVAFALAFHTLLMNQEPFHRIEYSLAKTFVMMVGELDFGSIFHSQNYLNTENSLPDGEEDFFLTSVFYQNITYVIFTLFIVVMSILIMNLLVGLAVHDVHAITEKAKLHSLAMQVQLVMEVQQGLPICIWRSSVIRKKRFYVNRASTSWLRKWYRALNGDEDRMRQAVKICMKNREGGDLMHETATTDQRLTNMKYRLMQIEKKVVTIGGTVNKGMAKQSDELAKHSDTLAKQADELSGLKDRFDRIEKKIDELLKYSHESK